MKSKKIEAQSKLATDARTMAVTDKATRRSKCADRNGEQQPRQHVKSTGESDEKRVTRELECKQR